MTPRKTLLLALGITVVAAASGYFFMLSQPSPRPEFDPAPPTEEPPLAPAANPYENWDTLARDLESLEPATKTAALAALAKTTYQKRPQLEQFLQTVKDPVVRRAAQMKLDGIYEQLATNPPPISVHLEHATLQGVMNALNAEMGTQMIWQGGRDSGDFNLDAENVPFWEVISRLSKQGMAWGVDASAAKGDDIVFMYHASGGVGMASNVVSGPFFMWAIAYDLKTTAPSFMLRYCILVDPRLAVYSWGFSMNNKPLEIGNDSTGNQLRPYNEFGKSPDKLHAFRGSTQIPFTPTPGKFISYIRTHAVATTITPAQSISIDAIDTKGSWKGSLGNAQLTVSAAEDSTAGTLNILCTVQSPDPTDNLLLQILDKSGDVRWGKRNFPEGAAQAAVPLNAAPGAPYQLRARLDKRTQDIAADLELKEIPITKQ